MTDVKFNLQQQPKTRGYLETWVPRPGHVLLQMDFSAVEPTILAEVSKCPNYRKLYGPEAKPNDVYLFVGSRFPMFKEKFLAHYNPEDPTPEGIALTKKLYKAERNIAKESHLAMQYGGGAGVVHGALTRKEIDISFQEVCDMHRSYWSPELFAVVKDYERKLKREWRQRGGWILNPLGRPFAVSSDKEKDILNTAIQSAGHDCLQKVIRFTDEQRTKKKIPMYPWIVDYHDETIWECEESAAEEGLDAMRQSMVKLNETLGWEIVVKGEPTTAMNLAEIKCED